MKLQCCFCKHIICNPEWDEMLDCELATEETGVMKCCYDKSSPFKLFELDPNSKTCISYLKAYKEEYGRPKAKSEEPVKLVPGKQYLISYHLFGVPLFSSAVATYKEEVGCDALYSKYFLVPGLNRKVTPSEVTSIKNI